MGIWDSGNLLDSVSDRAEISWAKVVVKSTFALDLTAALSSWDVVMVYFLLGVRIGCWGKSKLEAPRV